MAGRRETVTAGAHLDWASERLLGVAIERAPIAFTALDAGGALLAVNRMACVLTGYAREELLELRVTDVAKVPALAASFGAEPAAPGVLGGRGVVLRREGPALEVEIRFGWGRSDDAPPLVATWRPSDPTALAADLDPDPGEALALSRAQERWLGVAFRHAPLPVVVFDGEGRYLAANDAAADVSGYSREELMAMGVWDLVLSEHREREQADLTQQRGIRSGAARIRCRDGSMKDVAFDVATSTVAERLVRIAVWWEAGEGS